MSAYQKIWITQLVLTALIPLAGLYNCGTKGDWLRRDGIINAVWLVALSSIIVHGLCWLWFIV